MINSVKGIKSNNSDFKFAKTKEGARLPVKRLEDAGYDIFPCFDEEYIKIEPHKTAIIPTGIASACTPDWSFLITERSSLGTKGIACRCGVIDSGYRGEWSIVLTNTTDFPFIIVKRGFEFITGESGTIKYPYEKALAQFLIIPVPKVSIEEISYDELKEISSERGTGRFGSTGN